MLELRAANDLLNGLIRLKVNRGRRWRQGEIIPFLLPKKCTHLRPKPKVSFSGAKPGRNILIASAQRKATSHLL